MLPHKLCKHNREGDKEQGQVAREAGSCLNTISLFITFFLLFFMFPFPGIRYKKQTIFHLFLSLLASWPCHLLSFRDGGCLVVRGQVQVDELAKLLPQLEVRKLANTPTSMQTLCALDTSVNYCHLTTHSLSLEVQ